MRGQLLVAVIWPGDMAAGVVRKDGGGGGAIVLVVGTHRVVGGGWRIG